MRKTLLTLLVVLLIAAGSVFVLPSLLDRKMNSVESPAPYAASEPANQLHQQLFIADLHDDVLLWERDLLKRLANFVSDWEKDPQRVAAILATEGLQPIEGKLENVDTLYNAGFRITGLTHFFDNEVGGSAHGLEKSGLTPLGRLVIKRVEAKSMLIDLAHASRPLIDDVLGMAARPLLVSHTGVEGTCKGTRNLSDKHLQAIAATGGVIGIGYWDAAVCATSVEAIVNAIRYTVDLIGVQHVALGSDFNGTIHAPFDVTGLAQLTEGLLKAGFSHNEIAAIMGGNVQRLLLASLPEN